MDEGANKEIRVFIDRQILIALENGKEKYKFDIVTGRDGKETTAGKYPGSAKIQKIHKQDVRIRDAIFDVFH